MDLKETLKKYLFLDAEADRLIRSGRDPGEEAMQELEELYIALWFMVNDDWDECSETEGETY